MNVRRVSTLVCAAVLTLSVASACSSSGKSAGGGGSSPGTGSQASGAGAGDLGGAANEAALKSLYDKAVAAGQSSVVIYGPTAGTDQKLYDAFKKSFPKITPSGVAIVGPPMDAKLGAENSSGKHIGDIAYTAVPNVFDYATKGYSVPYTPVTAPPASALVARSVGPNKSFYCVTVQVTGIVTREGDSLPIPKTWTDLTKSAYKDKLVMYDPTAVGATADNFAHLDVDPKYSGLLKGLKDNKIELTPGTSLTAPLDAVAQGRKGAAIVLPYSFALAAKNQSAPIKFSLLDSDNYIVQLYASQLKGAPHPLAAQLWESWLFTPAAQQAMADEGTYSSVLGAPAPAGQPELAKVAIQKPLSFEETAAKVNATIGLAKSTFGG